MYVRLEGTIRGEASESQVLYQSVWWPNWLPFARGSSIRFKQNGLNYQGDFESIVAEVFDAASDRKDPINVSVRLEKIERIG